MERLAAAPFIETGLGILLGVVFLLTKRTDLAQFTWILSVALGVSRYAYSQKLEAELEPLANLADIIDLQSKDLAPQFEAMHRSYLKITEPEFLSVKDAIVHDCIEQLERIERDRTSGELATSDYFNWLFPLLETAKSGQQIWAISMMLGIEWERSPAEDRFLELNLAAARRRVEVERIFVVSSGDLEKLGQNPYTRAQVDASGRHLRTLVVVREYLEKHDPQLLSDLGDGLIGVDDRVVLVDRATPEGYRGYVTMNGTEKLRLRRVYDNLRVMARPLTSELFSPSSESEDSLIGEVARLRRLLDERETDSGSSAASDEPSPSSGAASTD